MKKLLILLALAVAQLTGAQTMILPYVGQDMVGIGPNTVTLTARHCQGYSGPAACAADPSTIYQIEIGHNLKTNAGVDFIAQQISGTASTGSAQWIALSTSSSAVNATDTSLPSEVVGNGLSRAQGAYAHTNGTTVYTVTLLFTATGAQAGIWKVGLLTAASSGTLVYEILLGSSISMNLGDQLSAQWTVTIS